MHGNGISQNDVELRFLENKLILLSEYKNGKTKVDVKCFCGNIFKTLPQSVFAKLTTSCGCKQKHNQSDIIKKFANRKLKLLSEYKNSKTKVNVKCFCGNIFETIPQSVLSGGTKSCGCLCITGPNSNSNKWNGYKEIPGSYFSSLKCSAKKRNLQLEITIEDIWKVFEKQNRKCKISGLEISFASSQKNRIDTTASLDRIDSSKGYTKDNIQWVHKIVNRMKNNSSDKDFIKMCNVISGYNQCQQNKPSVIK